MVDLRRLRDLAAAPPPGLVVAALDVGGTKLEAGLVSAEGRILARARCATPARAGSEDMWRAVAALMEELRDHAPDAEPVAVGCGTGGPMRRGGTAVSPLNIPAWRDEPVRDRLSALWGLPAVVDNDAKALALAEGWLGAARHVDDYLAMVVSTGVGGGLVLDGRLVDGAQGNAGHVGHVIVEPDGRTCACGAQGCLEAEASGPSIEARTGRPPADAPPEERRRAGALVGRAVASVANLCDLGLAVVAGSVALGFGATFFDSAQAELDRRARLAFSSGARVVPAGCGSDGPLLGAAALALCHD